MARPRLDRLLDQFTSGDLAAAAGLTPRNVGLLAEHGLLPDAHSDGEGQGGHRLYDYDGLKRVAAIGALNGAGVELLLAARLLGILRDDFGGETPSNMRSCLIAAMAATPGHAPWPKAVEGAAGFSLSSEFWIHHGLNAYASGYVPGAALDGDACVEIADRTYVALKPRGERMPKTLSMASNVSLRVNPVAKISNWTRGAEPHIEDLGDLIGSFDFEEHPENRRRMRDLEIEFEAAFDNAVGVLRINLSLAIRNSLDRLAAQRNLSVKTAIPA